MNVEKLRSHLKDFGQEHLLAFHEKLSDDDKNALYNELLALDLDRVKHNFELGVETSKSSGKKDNGLEPLPESVRDSLATAEDDMIDSWQDLGLRAIADNKASVLLLAGGQGTRLNVP